MKRRKLTCCAWIVMLAGLPGVALACLWDYDTLRQERARFPSALELITGKFLRHSPEFYQWRIEDRLKKLESSPKELTLHDDLAVAYQKTGRHEEAVATMLAKEQIQPGLYETYANLGTFHVLAGDFQQGLPYIEKALAINPDAHFGRERYQKWLVEYALSRQQDGKLVLPLVSDRMYNFQSFLESQRSGRSLADRQAAVKGILGMMRFANHANPLLLEALGDVLIAMPDSRDNPSSDAKRLAATAYLKASYEVEDETAKEAYRELAEMALLQQLGRGSNQLTLFDFEDELTRQLADAESWYSELRQRELDWIESGQDADVEFDRLYQDEPTSIDTDPRRTSIQPWHTAVVGAIAIAILIAIVVAIPALRRSWRRRQILSSR